MVVTDVPRVIVGVVAGVTSIVGVTGVASIDAVTRRSMMTLDPGSDQVSITHVATCVTSTTTTIQS